MGDARHQVAQRRQFLRLRQLGDGLLQLRLGGRQLGAARIHAAGELVVGAPQRQLGGLLFGDVGVGGNEARQVVLEAHRHALDEVGAAVGPRALETMRLEPARQLQALRDLLLRVARTVVAALGHQRQQVLEAGTAEQRLRRKLQHRGKGLVPQLQAQVLVEQRDALRQVVDDLCHQRIVAGQLGLEPVVFADVGPGGDEAALGDRLATNLQHHAIGAHAREDMRLEAQRALGELLHQRVDVLHAAELAALDVEAPQVGHGHGPFEKFRRQLQQLQEALVPQHDAQLAVDHRDAAGEVLAQRVQHLGVGAGEGHGREFRVAGRQRARRF